MRDRPTVLPSSAAARARLLSPLVVLALLVPALASAAIDPDADGDGLPDAAEQALGTDPLVVDTDGDEVGDGAEALVLGTDPLDAVTWCRDGFVQDVGFNAAYELVTADLDGDGRDDLLTSTAADDLTWFPNGLSTVGSSALWLDAVGPIGAADLDGDGWTDVFGASLRDGAVSWSANSGGGWFFGGSRPVGAVRGAVAVDAADVDADGDVDLLVASRAGDGVAWFANLGGTFAAAASAVTGVDGPVSLRAADLDADGRPDLVLGAADGGVVTWSHNHGGGFDPALTLGASLDPRGLAVADVDADGDADVLFTDTTGAWWAENLGVGAFAAAAPVLLDPTGSDRVGVVDVDADGAVDVVVKSAGRGVVEWVARTDGAFAAQRVLFSGDDPTHAPMAVGDFDGDGDGDAVTHDRLSGLAVTFNLASDVDHDGLTEAAEACVTGTDPGVADTDGGGLDDGAECDQVRDPRDPDDDDGVSPRLSSPAPGAVPGPNTWTVDGATPGGAVAVVYGRPGSRTPIPGCPGRFVDVGQPGGVVGTAAADASGVAEVTRDVPAGAAGREVVFQAVDTTSCEVSATVRHTF